MCCSSASVTLRGILWNMDLMNSTGTLKPPNLPRFWYVMRNFTAQSTDHFWVLKGIHLVTKLQTNPELVSKHHLSFHSFSHISRVNCKTQQVLRTMASRPSNVVHSAAPVCHSPAAAQPSLAPTHAPEKAAVPTGNCISNMTKTEHVKSWNFSFSFLIGRSTSSTVSMEYGEDYPRSVLISLPAMN